MPPPERTAPGHQRPAPAALPLIALIHLYRWLVSPMLGPRCRYLPTCSAYALETLARHGLVRGSWLAAQRVLRCHPWGASGCDPVPEKRG